MTTPREAILRGEMEGAINADSSGSDVSGISGSGSVDVAAAVTLPTDAAGVEHSGVHDSLPSTRAGHHQQPAVAPTGEGVRSDTGGHGQSAVAPPPSAEGLWTLVEQLRQRGRTRTVKPPGAQPTLAEFNAALARISEVYLDVAGQLESLLGQAEARAPEPNFDLAHKMQRLALDRAWRAYGHDAEYRQQLTTWLREHGLDVWRLITGAPALPSVPSDGTPEDR